MIFYKACNISDLKESYTAGTVTTCFKEAYLWYERYNSKKKNGINRHINKKSEIVIISIEYDELTLFDSNFFQKKGVTEHERVNCWTSSTKTKAQINTPVKYSVINKSEYAKLLVS